MASVTNTNLADWRDFLQDKGATKEEIWLVWRLYDWLERWTHVPTEKLQRVLEKASVRFGWKIPSNGNGE